MKLIDEVQRIFFVSAHLSNKKHCDCYIMLHSLQQVKRVKHKYFQHLIELLIGHVFLNSIKFKPK